MAHRRDLPETDCGPPSLIGGAPAVNHASPAGRAKARTPRRRTAALIGVVLAWALAAAPILAGPASAAEVAETHRYRIRHQWFGELGWHQITVRREDDRVVVEHQAELEVAILSFQAFHRRSRYREVWQGDRLVAFDGLTEDDGVPFVVTARAEGERLIVDGPSGHVEAPAQAAPSEPSLERAIERDWLFDIKTGELLAAQVTAAGSEPLELGEGTTMARRYEIAGDLEQQVWFAGGDVWVQWRLWRQGAAITLTRE